ncbi:hypothetical protein K439DRAFT_1378078, partial [Ramaria rubella]
RYLVHANASFASSEDPYFRKFISNLHPTYVPPSQYALTQTLLPAEFVCVH